MHNAAVMPHTDSVIGTAQASRILDVHPVTITRWAAEGRLTPVGKLPGKNGAFLFNRADVEALASSLLDGTAHRLPVLPPLSDNNHYVNRTPSLPRSTARRSRAS